MSLFQSLPRHRRSAVREAIQRSYRRARNRKIIRLFIEGELTANQIAERFKITPSAVNKIRRGVSGAEDTADLLRILRAKEQDHG